MAGKTSTATKAANEPASKGTQRETPPPVVLGLASTILDLQRTAGNQSVGRLLGGSLLQPKLRIGPPGDAYEREADRVADAVLREGTVPVPVSTAGKGAGVQRMCAECEEEMLQRSAVAAAETGEVQSAALAEPNTTGTTSEYFASWCGLIWAGPFGVFGDVNNQVLFCPTCPNPTNAPQSPQPKEFEVFWDGQSTASSKEEPPASIASVPSSGGADSKDCACKEPVHVNIQTRRSLTHGQFLDSASRVSLKYKCK